MTDQTSCCVDDGLESVQELYRKADQQRVTVIKLRQHKTGDERHNSMTRQRPLDVLQLAQDAKSLQQFGTCLALVLASKFQALTLRARMTIFWREP